MIFGAAIIRHWSKTLFRVAVVTGGALKLNYASVIFVDPGVQIDET